MPETLGQSAQLTPSRFELFVLPVKLTDYLLVKAAHLERAIEALRQDGHQVGEWRGDYP